MAASEQPEVRCSGPIDQRSKFRVSISSKCYDGACLLRFSSPVFRADLIGLETVIVGKRFLKFISYNSSVTSKRFHM